MAEDIKKLIGGDPSSVDSWMPKLLDAIRADDSQFGDVVKDVPHLIKKKVVKAVKSE